MRAATGAAPAADVAAQTAAALALVSKHFSSSTWQPDVATLAPRLLRKAKAAYAYAKAAYTRDGAAASCTSSPAAKNCIGAACDRKSRGVRAAPHATLLAAKRVRGRVVSVQTTKTCKEEQLE